MNTWHPKHENDNKKCLWDLHGFNESSDHHCEHDKDENDHHEHHENCVREVLKAILHAQEKAKKHNDGHNSCDKESIHELLGETRRPKKNTIPFLLYCGDCEPFKATGVTTFTDHSKRKQFACITSFIFKIKDLNDDCAVLELLTFKPDKRCHSDQKGDRKNHCSPCCQIDHKDVDDLMGTGICITVDLSCFCAISTLPAVRL